MIKIEKIKQDNLNYTKKIKFLGIPIIKISCQNFKKTFRIFGIKFSRYLWRDEIRMTLKRVDTELQNSAQKLTEVSQKIKFQNRTIRTSKELYFSSGHKFIGQGFYKQESWGCWLHRCFSLLLLPVEVDKDIRLKFELREYNHQENEPKTLSVYMAGKKAITTSETSFELNISKYDIDASGVLQLNFISTGGVSPSEVSGSADTRVLSFGLCRITSDTDMIIGGLDLDFMNYLFGYKRNCMFNNEEWDSYLGRENTTDKLQRLEKGLDEDSVALVRMFLKRRQNPFEFAAHEREAYEKSRELDISAYKIANKAGFQPDVFYFKNGLRFVEPELIKQYLEGRDVIDGGACSGDSALMFSRYEFVHKVYAFEPVTSIFEGLRKTLEINHCNKAEAVHKGVSDVTGTAEIMGENCEIITVDEFAKDKKIGCIKFDLEGMESQALKGCLETIKRDKPLLMICLYHTPQDFFEIKPMLEELNLGYRFKIVDTEPCNSDVGIHAVLLAY